MIFPMIMFKLSQKISDSSLGYLLQKAAVMS